MELCARGCDEVSADLWCGPHSIATIILSFASLRVDKALLKMDPAKAMLNYANGMVLSFIHLLITVALNGV